MSARNALTPRVFLFRHGETEWAKLGRSTGTTEIELNLTGAAQVSSAAATLVGPGKLLDPRRLKHIFVSPRKRTKQTLEILLASNFNLIKEKTTCTEDIAEWDYGDYEGLKTHEIRILRQERGQDNEKKWDIWTDGCEGGESRQEISKRLDRLISEIKEIQKPYMYGEEPADVLLVAHGLILRCFTKRWVGLSIASPLPIMLEPGAISVLSYKNNDINEPALHIGLALPAEEDTQRRIEETETIPIEPPITSGEYEVNEAVIKAFPIPNTKVHRAFSYGHSIYGKTAKIVAHHPTNGITDYFLKEISAGKGGRSMCIGEFESLKAIYMVSPEFVPKPYAWGKFEWEDTYFLLTEFRDVDKQPAEPDKLAPRLADMHFRSQSPTGKFGFHTQTYHGTIAQAISQWDNSWCAVFSQHLGYFMNVVNHYLKWPEFEVVCELTLRKVVPRLLLPLQAEGRILKPSLIHGDCWDGNTATDAKTGHAFIFDACSFYGHNEYDIGNWRAPRHRLSKETYINLYKRYFPVSEPVEDWDARNRLYSLCFNIGNIINIPSSQEHQVVYDDMTNLCKMFCPQDLEAEIQKFKPEV